MLAKLQIRKWSVPRWWPNFKRRLANVTPTKTTRYDRVRVVNDRFYYHMRQYLKRLNLFRAIASGRFKPRYMPQRPFKPTRWYFKKEFITEEIRELPLYSSPFSPKSESIRQFFPPGLYYRFPRRFTPSVQHVVKIKPVANNIFINLTYQDKTAARRVKKSKFLTRRAGRSVTLMTAGAAGFKGPKRSSLVAAEEAGRRLAKLLRDWKIKRVWVMFYSARNRKSFSALKGLLDRRFRVRLAAFSMYPKVSHGLGLRPRKPRRV